VAVLVDAGGSVARFYMIPIPGRSRGSSLKCQLPIIFTFIKQLIMQQQGLKMVKNPEYVVGRKDIIEAGSIIGYKCKENIP